MPFQAFVVDDQHAEIGGKLAGHRGILPQRARTIPTFGWLRRRA
jgi:hypothetical protein